MGRPSERAYTIDILSCGMVSGVGHSAAASCAAMRVGIAGFVETRFMFDGEWLMGCPVPFEQPCRGRERLLRMVVPSILECLAGESIDPGRTALLLCLAERDRAGRLDDLDESLLDDVERRVGIRFHDASRVFRRGRIGGIDALAYAREQFQHGLSSCVLAGVDSYLVAETLTWLHQHRRILTAENADGFIPGEAAAALLLAPSPGAGRRFVRCVGVGGGTEPAPLDSERPLRADGLVEAIRAAFADAGVGWDAVHYRITDASGSQYAFKEAALAIGRALRPVKKEFDLWHPADCIGDCGAASGVLNAVWAVTALRAGYARIGHALVWGASDGPLRAVALLALGEDYGS